LCGSTVHSVKQAMAGLYMVEPMRRPGAAGDCPVRLDPPNHRGSHDVARGTALAKPVTAMRIALHAALVSLVVAAVPSAVLAGGGSGGRGARTGRLDPARIETRSHMGAAVREVRKATDSTAIHEALDRASGTVGDLALSEGHRTTNGHVQVGFTASRDGRG